MSAELAAEARRRRRRFARYGRIVPIAVVQLFGTVAASGTFGARPGHGGPPFHSPVSLAAVHPGALSAFAIVLLLGSIAVLPWRWRWPVSVLATVAACTIAFAFVAPARGPYVAALTMALTNAVLLGHRVPALVGAAVSFLVLPWADFLTGRTPVLPWTAMTLTAAWLIATLAIAELARVRIARSADARAARAAEARRRADDERVRIARELHDSVAHNMSLINLQSGVALHLGRELPEQTRAALTAIHDASATALAELRAILGVLRSPDGTNPATRAPGPSLRQLPDLVDRARAAGLDVSLTISGTVERVGGITDASTYRIAQEAVTNVMKHAPRHRVTITVSVGTDIVDITVSDEPGADSAERRRAASIGSSGNGIIGMRERAAAVGGTLSAGPTPSGGWTVRARLPILASTSDSPQSEEQR